MTIAHEVGHALGLPHAATGVMKAKLSVRDVVALRALRLRFTREQAAAMHHALRVRAGSLAIKSFSNRVLETTSPPTR